MPTPTTPPNPGTLPDATPVAHDRRVMDALKRPATPPVKKKPATKKVAKKRK